MQKFTFLLYSSESLFVHVPFFSSPLYRIEIYVYMSAFLFCCENSIVHQMAVVRWRLLISWHQLHCCMLFDFVWMDRKWFGRQTKGKNSSVAKRVCSEGISFWTNPTKRIHMSWENVTNCTGRYCDLHITFPIYIYRMGSPHSFANKRIPSKI